ncbi:MAG: hypothetical protein F6K58_09265 [Symploca sp. SIO2E9]|nr:hypothetical protein [Symploca sp. SIO2E9]
MYTINTDGLELNLGLGEYKFNFWDFQTPDSLDTISIELQGGAASYNLGNGWQSFSESLEFDREYFVGEVNQFKIRIDSPEATLFTRTTGELEYPDDDLASNGVIEFSYESILPEPVAYPLEEINFMGSVVLRDYCTELRTDRYEFSVEQLEDQFFQNAVDLSPYGVSGSAGLWNTNSGVHKLTFDMRGDYDQANLLFWNGQELVEINPVHISNSTISIYVDALSDQWGFVLLDSNDASNDTDLRISGIEWLGDSSQFNLNGGYLANLTGITPTDSIGNAKIEGDSVTLTTGKYDRAASSLGQWTMGDKEYLKNFGTEGTAVTFTDLESGIYSFDWSMYSSDRDNHDALYAWNGKELTKIGERASAQQISSARWVQENITATVDVVYDYLTIIALDEVDKRGTTDFTIENFQYSEQLDYTPPEPININPDIQTGDINLREGYTGIATGGGDRAISTISEQLTGNRDELTGLGTEGSYGSWIGLENGYYEVTWSLYTSENDLDRDAIYWWHDDQAYLLAEREDANIQTSRTRAVSDRNTTVFEVTDNQLSFFVLDEFDKSGTTELRIYGIEKVFEPVDVFDMPPVEIMV